MQERHGGAETDPQAPSRKPAPSAGIRDHPQGPPPRLLQPIRSCPSACFPRAEPGSGPSQYNLQASLSCYYPRASALTSHWWLPEVAPTRTPLQARVVPGLPHLLLMGPPTPKPKCTLITITPHVQSPPAPGPDRREVGSYPPTPDTTQAGFLPTLAPKWQCPQPTHGLCRAGAPAATLPPALCSPPGPRDLPPAPFLQSLCKNRQPRGDAFSWAYT